MIVVRNRRLGRAWALGTDPGAKPPSRRRRNGAEAWSATGDPSLVSGNASCRETLRPLGGRWGRADSRCGGGGDVAKADSCRGASLRQWQREFGRVECGYEQAQEEEEAVEGLLEELPFELQVHEVALEVVCTYLHSSVAELERCMLFTVNMLLENWTMKTAVSAPSSRALRAFAS
nr:magnesium transporter MRS2-4-like isoform X2 [Ipomoea trifida]